MIPLLKLLHLLGVVLLLGNFITSLYWKAKADSTGDLKTVNFAQRHIRRGDRIFTHIGMILIFITGFGLTGMQKIKILHTGWVLWGLILFIVSVLLWAFILRPSQKKMISLSDRALKEGTLDRSFYRLSTVWYVISIVVTLLLLTALFLMVYRPI